MYTTILSYLKNHHQILPHSKNQVTTTKTLKKMRKKIDNCLLRNHEKTRDDIPKMILCVTILLQRSEEGSDFAVAERR